jgi:hypothetical protein
VGGGASETGATNKTLLSSYPSTATTNGTGAQAAAGNGIQPTSWTAVYSATGAGVALGAYVVCAP